MIAIIHNPRWPLKMRARPNDFPRVSHQLRDKLAVSRCHDANVNAAVALHTRCDVWYSLFSDDGHFLATVPALCSVVHV